MMRLTRDEKLLVAGILAALLAGAGVKHYRETTRVKAAEEAVNSARADSATSPRAD